MSNIEVVGLGALNIDHIYKVERILNDGEVVVAESISFPGGSAANTIYGLAKLGVSTGFIGAVGDDVDGKIMLLDFQRAGVDISQIRSRHQAKTGLVLCLSDRLGRRSLCVTPGANSLLTMDDLEFDYINQSRMLHLSSFADDRQFKVVLELMGRLDSSTKVSFGPGALFAAKGLEALTPILSRTYVLFINQNELEQLTGEGIIAGAESCLKQGCRIIAVTLGQGTRLELGEGIGRETVIATSYIRDAGSEYAIQANSRNLAPEVDTIGAGDAFATGFIYGLLNDKGLEECGRLGDIVAQFAVTKLGARGGLPTFNELAQRYQELYSEQV